MPEITNFLDAMRAPAAPPIQQPPADCGPVNVLEAWHAAISGTAPPLALADSPKCAASWLGQFDLAKRQGGSIVSFGRG